MCFWRFRSMESSRFQAIEGSFSAEVCGVVPFESLDEAIVAGWSATLPEVAPVRVTRKHDRNPVELAAGLSSCLGAGTLVIMEACALCSRQRAASTACAVLPLPGIVA